MHDNVEKLLRLYDLELYQAGVLTKKHEDIVPEPNLGLQHVRWMIQQMILTDPETFKSNTRKTNRWLGFIQGMLWACDRKGILGLRDESRDLYKN